MYACGETVYNYMHIGHARPMIIFDALRRYLEYRGYTVTYVRNFTDVDDKIIARANGEGVDFQTVSDRYIAAELEDAAKLGVRPPTAAPRATQEIAAMVQIISRLVGQGHAYATNGSVFFDTLTFPGYGKLSKKNPEELEAGARVEVDPDKKTPLDFVLWKPAKPGEPSWPSPWGPGRPGWHIECSALAKQYLGDTIDIHAGGTDLIFPHHENEIAQSECANGLPFARYWLHNGLITVEGRKMSKSFNNFFTVRDIAQQFTHEEIRFFILNAHYRSAINFSEELLRASSNALERIRACLERLKFMAASASDTVFNAREAAMLADAALAQAAFFASLDNDFNTADALAAVFELVRFANIHVTDATSPPFADTLCRDIQKLCNVLGVFIAPEAQGEDTGWIEALLAKRQAARAAKDFALADGIREELAAKGILLEDTPGGPRWRRTPQEPRP
jgi:cysteinyl-tRNA synthetase